MYQVVSLKSIGLEKTEACVKIFCSFNKAKVFRASSVCYVSPVSRGDQLILRNLIQQVACFARQSRVCFLPWWICLLCALYALLQHPTRIRSRDIAWDLLGVLKLWKAIQLEPSEMVSPLFSGVVLVKARSTPSRISSLVGQSTSAFSGFRCIWNKHEMPPIPLFASSEYRDDGTGRSPMDQDGRAWTFLPDATCMAY
jgi:hypothetical protein